MATHPPTLCLDVTPFVYSGVRECVSVSHRTQESTQKCVRKGNYFCKTAKWWGKRVEVSRLWLWKDILCDADISSFGESLRLSAAWRCPGTAQRFRELRYAGGTGGDNEQSMITRQRPRLHLTACDRISKRAQGNSCLLPIGSSSIWTLFCPSCAHRVLLIFYPSLLKLFLWIGQGLRMECVPLQQFESEGD